MADSNRSRRTVLRSIGTLATIASGSIGGCLEQSTTASDHRSPTTALESPTMPPGEEVPDRTPGPNETSTFGESRPYVRFSARPSKFDLDESYWFTSVKPAVAAANRIAFGDGFESFWARWVRTVGGVPLEDHKLSVWIRFVTAVVGDFERSDLNSWYEELSLDQHDSYRGFDMYSGPVEDGYYKKVIGVGDGIVFTDSLHGFDEGRKRIRHLIDLYEGVAAPYYEQSSVYSDTVEKLPQGVFTMIYRRIKETDHWLNRYDIATMGQTLRLDGKRSPATGITVLRFENSVASPRDRALQMLNEAVFLRRFPVNEPTIRSVDGQTVVVEDAVDPDEMF